ncbi:claudin-19-like isoform X3 [Styela clava]
MGQCGNLGLLIGIAATVGILYCLGSRYWKVNSQVSSQQVNRGIQSYEGLWVRCTSYIPGQFQCDNFDESYLALPAPLQCQRAFMVIAGICCVAGLVAGAMGQECIHAVSGKPKIWSARSGGILMIAAGFLTVTSASWYASEVVQQFYTNENQNTSFQYQFGAALFIGWVAGGLALISGCLMACCTCGEPEDEADGYRYTYNPPKTQPSRNTEYV